MLEVIEKLLILQDRDRAILRLRSELSRIGPERQMLSAKSAGVEAALAAAKTRLNHLESDRKKLELEVESKKQLIEKYSVQQFQTRKNEEYRALAHEIETCKAAIVKIEDQELELMEQAEKTQREVQAAKVSAEDMKRVVDKQISDLAGREVNLRRDLELLESDRDLVASAVEDGVRDRYERIAKNRGEKVLVGVAHRVCGGCHMRLPPQVLLSCKAGQELVACTNCGRILYYTKDMDVAVVE